MEGRCFVTPPNAAEAEGAYRVTATLGGLSAYADITVRSPDLSGLIAVRDRDTASDPAGIDRAESEQAAGVAAVSAGSGSGRTALLVGIGLLLLAAICGFALLVIRARRKGAQPSHRAPASSGPASTEDRPSDPLKNSGTALIPKTAPLPSSANSCA